MSRFWLRPRTALVVVLLLQGSVAADASPLVWQRALDAPSSERLDLHYAEPLPAGGYRLTGGVIGADFNDGLGEGFYGVVQEFDAQDQPVGPPRFGPMPRMRTHSATEANVVVPMDPRAFLLDLREVAPSPCRRSNLGGGRELRRFDREYRLLGLGYGPLEGDLDGEDGNFAASYVLRGPVQRMQRLYRQQADCSVEVLGDFPYWFQSLHNSPSAAFAFAVTDGESAAAPKVLRGFDRAGLRWSLALENIEGVASARALTVVDGDLIVGVHGGDSSSLYRIDSTGSVRWRQDLPWKAPFTQAMHSERGLLLVAPAEQNPAVTKLTVALVDPDRGELRFAYQQDQGNPGLIPAADPTAPEILVSISASFGLDQRLHGIDSAGNGRELRSLPFDVQPLLQLADGRLLASRGRSFYGGDATEEPGRRLLRLDPLDPSADEELHIELPWTERALRIAPDPDGSLLLTRESGRYVLEALGHDGERRWRTRFPKWTLRGSPEAEPQALLRHTDGHVCLIFASPGRTQGESSLSCVRREDGAVRFLRADVSIKGNWHRPQLLLEGSDGLPELVVRDQPTCTSAICPGSLRRVAFAADGTSSERLRLSETDQVRLSAAARLGTGELLVSETARDGSLQRWLAVDEAGDTQVLATVEAPFATAIASAQALDDGAVLVVLSQSSTGAAIGLLLDADAQLRWSRQLPGWFGSFGALAAGGAEGLALVLQDGDGTLLLTRLDASGAPLWQRAVGKAGLDRVLGLKLQASDAILLGTQRDRRLLLRRFADADGADGAAESIQLEGPVQGLLSWTADGQATTLVRGARQQGSPPRPARVQQWRLREPAPCEATLSAGFWFDPGSSGQGLFLHPLQGGNLLAATWLGFTANGDVSRADLRWFSLLGEVTADQSIELQLRSSQGGALASGPAVPSAAVGEARLHHLHCDLLALDYHFESGEFAGLEGRTFLSPATPPGGSGPAGIWYSPATSGQGLLLQGIDDADGSPQRLVGAWASFDPAGAEDDPTAQHWLTLDGQLGANGRYRVDLLRTIGGSFVGRSTANTLRVGSAEIHLPACDRLELNYAFDESGAAAEFAGLSGALVLQRLDGCPTGRK